jgi:hypothetical protein
MWLLMGLPAVTTLSCEIVGHDQAVVLDLEVAGQGLARREDLAAQSTARARSASWSGSPARQQRFRDRRPDFVSSARRRWSA